MRLDRAVKVRSAEFARAGAATLTDFRLAALTPAPPRIVLLLDGFGEFSAMFDDGRPDSPFERLLALLSGGRSVGVHVVITADRRASVRSGVAAHLANRLVLRLATADDLVTFGVPMRVAETVELGAGRGFTTEGSLMQIALPQPAAGEDLAGGFRSLGRHLVDAWPGLGAPAIESLPSTVAIDALPTGDGGSLPIGVGGPALDVVGVSIADRHFLASGPYRSGRSNVLAAIAMRLAGAGREMHLLAPRRSRLIDAGVWTTVARGPEQCAESARDLALRVGEMPEANDARMVVFVDDAGDLQDAQSQAALERIVRLGRDRGVRVVAAAETSAARSMTNAWIRDLRRDGQGILLMPESQTDGDILGVGLPRRERMPMVAGRGYLVDNGAAVIVQVAQVS